jgi:hypothetical protein
MKTFYYPKRKLTGLKVDAYLIGGGMVAGGKFQDIYDRSTVQNYEIGTRLVMDDRVFRYAKAAGNLSNMEYPVVNSHIIPTDGYEGAVSGTPKIGDTTITVLDTGAAGARPINYYAGGYAHIYSATVQQRQTRRVLASTVGNGESITLTLDQPLTGYADLLTVTTVDVYPSIYSEVMAPGAVSSGEETFVGYACALLQSGEYGWIQTWGPRNGHYNIKFPGENGPNDRECFFNQAGEIITMKQGGSYSGEGWQRAGYVLPVTKSLYGSVFIMLQLAP